MKQVKNYALLNITANISAFWVGRDGILVVKLRGLLLVDTARKTSQAAKSNLPSVFVAAMSTDFWAVHHPCKLHSINPASSWISKYWKSYVAYCYNTSRKGRICRSAPLLTSPWNCGRCKWRSREWWLLELCKILWYQLWGDSWGHTPSDHSLLLLL